MRKRSSSIQNMLNAFKMITLENSDNDNNNEEQQYDEGWSDDNNEALDLEQELERRSQVWQTPQPSFVASTIFTTQNERALSFSNPKNRSNNFRLTKQKAAAKIRLAQTNV